MSDFPMPITAVFAALFALMLVGISVRVTVLRAKKKVNLFDGGDAELGAAIRVQGNFTEYVPLALALMAILESMGVPSGWMYAYGAVLFAARLAHAWALYSNVFPARVVGTSTTWLLLAAGALAVLARVV